MLTTTMVYRATARSFDDNTGVAWERYPSRDRIANLALEQAAKVVAFLRPLAESLDKGNESEKCCRYHSGHRPPLSADGYNADIVTGTHDLLLRGPGIIGVLEITVPTILDLVAQTESWIEFATEREQ